ncbi:MerR family transcriptional regulator [Heyndrickxia sporothermodurans]|uniref:MerR family transcriptional regulator n=1 Tax=Heyndrickxia sporothermodurans TaxID=46224 RepID=A0AB37HMF4_9BACI|nr:MerR family transcriptional regulator [Heyndrickxia sporothermodurans]MBL5768336.1 MerR family transcriptional regulator [Heyndrickxia sporothermodurans]MBL5771989.1 MerR family transcriptional regulator [Heyndrickxia sporothermodurans]MBL5775597.1 MerR family transcriptional regulator [Heyndrickxia sporothermodurans]MBL5779126.1 MerR family transcriptional regulator [Heyndrickxia sporothermodurans]MBL5783294.1 MerR family transcriptional regulator [Heyndrickxia sporothermodurans]
MKGNNKYSIGEFSEKTGISIRTLHYYDEIGLLQPEKHPTSGHRIYDHQDILTLQKIISLKFLGYSLDKITNLLKESSFSVDLNETLTLHLQALEKDKERIEQSITAIKRVIKLLEKEGEVDSAILFSLIHGIQTENIQKEWMERHMLADVMEELSNKTEEEKITLDQTFIQLAKEVKQLYGKPVEDPKVQEMIKTYIEASFKFLGDDLMERLAETNVEELDVQELENMTSPFTEDEQDWLNQAMEYYMKQTESE